MKKKDINDTLRTIPYSVTVVRQLITLLLQHYRSQTTMTKKK